MIKMYDFHGHPKKSGGDVLFARLHNLNLGAGVAGQVTDYLNGSYCAVFSLLWEGSAQVEVMLTLIMFNVIVRVVSYFFLSFFIGTFIHKLGSHFYTLVIEFIYIPPDTEKLS